MLIRLELSTGARLDFHHSAELSAEISDGDLSSPVLHEFEFDTDYGKDKAYGFYYEPQVCIILKFELYISKWCLR